MCMRITCPICKKPTWAGCGTHIEQVLAGVPKDQRCKCPKKPPKRAAPITGPKRGE